MDKQYLGHRYQISELEHYYGKNVHILSDPSLFSYLASLCSPETKQPTIYSLLKLLYEGLLHTVVNQEFPRKTSRVTTRMAAKHPWEGTFTAELVDREQRAVCVNLARAGTYPSHVCYSALNHLLDPDQVRQDHLMISRSAEGEALSAEASGSKIGGAIEDSIVIFPDPMGATGSTVSQALSLYKNSFGQTTKLGKPKKFIALHLIVTPEYLQNVQKLHSDLVIYAVRLDRGLSTQDVLSTRPGTKWELEKGLDAEHLIVPGGGGLGEILNNSPV